jgi:HK97 family phage prohead protease
MTKPNLERRGCAPSELRAAREDGSPGKLSGYAAVFDQLSDDLGGFRERIAAGAFAKSIADGADVRALIDHDPSKILGRSKAGTLRLAETSIGLAVEIDLPDTGMARDLSTMIDRGDVSQMSFGFYTRNDQWTKIDGEWVRTLLDAELFDVSVVTFPAYPQTEVALRGLTVARDADRPPEATIRLLRSRLALIRAASAEL